MSGERLREPCIVCISTALVHAGAAGWGVRRQRGGALRGGSKAESDHPKMRGFRATESSGPAGDACGAGAARSTEVACSLGGLVYSFGGLASVLLAGSLRGVRVAVGACGGGRECSELHGFGVWLRWDRAVVTGVGDLSGECSSKRAVVSFVRDVSLFGDRE